MSCLCPACSLEGTQPRKKPNLCPPAIIGTNFFSDRSPEYFANFHTSLFTMFQVFYLAKAIQMFSNTCSRVRAHEFMHICQTHSSFIRTCAMKTQLSHSRMAKQPTKVLTGDSWASGVARSLFEEGRTEPDVAFFFVSYILLAAVMLMNVVVAVLLGKLLLEIFVVAYHLTLP